MVRLAGLDDRFLFDPNGVGAYQATTTSAIEWFNLADQLPSM